LKGREKGGRSRGEGEGREVAGRKEGEGREKGGGRKECKKEYPKVWVLLEV
jgi:hypothetical protein